MLLRFLRYVVADWLDGPQRYKPLKVLGKSTLTALGLRRKRFCAYCGRNLEFVWRVEKAELQRIPETWHKEPLCIECFALFFPRDKLLLLKHFEVFHLPVRGPKKPVTESCEK